jgi:hypothetical protein
MSTGVSTPAGPPGENSLTNRPFTRWSRSKKGRDLRMVLLLANVRRGPKFYTTSAEEPEASFTRRIPFYKGRSQPNVRGILRQSARFICNYWPYTGRNRRYYFRYLCRNSVLRRDFSALFAVNRAQEYPCFRSRMFDRSKGARARP